MKAFILLAMVFIGQATFASDSTLYVILEKERYGYINRKGEIVIPPIFKYGGDFHNNMAVARLDSAYGYINKKGEFVIPPIYYYATDFIDNVALVVTEKGWGYLNTRGEQLIIEERNIFEWVGCSEVGIQLEEDKIKRSLFELVKEDGKEYKTIRHKLTNYTLSIQVEDGDWNTFREGLMLVKMNNKLAYIDTVGNVIWRQKEPYIKELHTLNVDFKPILDEVSQELHPEALKSEPFFSMDSSRTGLFLTVEETKNVKLSDSLTGIKLKLAYQNPYLEDTVRIIQKYCKFSLQVLDYGGNTSLISNKSGFHYWREIDQSFCIKITPQHYWTFILPKFEGYVKAKCIYKCRIAGQDLSTPPFDCSFNPSQYFNGNSSRNTRFIDTVLGRCKRWPSHNLRECGTFTGDNYD